MIRVEVESKMGSTRPSLNPTRGVYSKSNETEGRMRAFTPKPKEPACFGCRKVSAIGAGGKKSVSRGSNRRCPFAFKCTAGEKIRCTYFVTLRANIICRL